MRYVHTNIVSRDWRNLAQFYIEVFECKIVPPARKQSGNWLSVGTGTKNASLEGVHLRLPGHGDAGPTLEIYSYAKMKNSKPAVANRIGLRHLAFEVGDVSWILEKIIEYGGSALGKVSSNTIQGLGIIEFVYAADPEGNILEIQHWHKN